VLRGLHRRPLSREWWIGECWAVGFVSIAAAAVADLYDFAEPFSAVSDTTRIVGVVIALGGFASTEWAVVAMGASWRVDVDESAPTRLVTGGPFQFVRNPIYSSMVVLALGLALMVPMALSFVGAGLVFLALELQVRVLEEPHLLRVHGEAWIAYASAVGRFVPGMGRLKRPPDQARPAGCSSPR
jgi:protein-S-isoprenylcysteine O-methyltransferase Ste14